MLPPMGAAVQAITISAGVIVTAYRPFVRLFLGGQKRRFQPHPTMWPCGKTALLDHLVGYTEQIGWHIDAEHAN